MPAIVIGLTKGVKNDRDTAVVIGGVIPLIINFLIQVISFFLDRKGGKN